MAKGIVFNLKEVEWIKFEKAGVKKIYWKNLDPTGLIRKLTIRLMKIEPGGEFPLHTDPYSHLFYLVKGIGEERLGEDVYKLERGHVTFVKAGESHGYRNIGEEIMYLLAINIHEG